MNSSVAAPAAAGLRWHGLGLWNLYFLGEFALVWQGVLNFQALPNLLLVAVLLLPLPRWAAHLRTLLAVPAGLALLYRQSWLPPLARLLEHRDELREFSAAYVLELAERVFDWQWLGAAALLLLGYRLLAPWLRLTTLSLGGLLWLAVPALPGAAPAPTAPLQAAAPAAGSAPVAAPAADGPPDSAALERYLADFYQREGARQVDFAAAQPGPAFDLLLLHICSMSWDDLRAVGLDQHPLLQRLDIRFDDFNSATAYSGPAALRLQRASCGQSSHAALYEPAPPRCQLFEQLARLGYRTDLVLNHDGRFDNYLQSIRASGNLPAPLFPVSSLPRALVGFDASPIARDRDALDAWQRQRQDDPAARVSLLYQSITLHDGNRRLLADGGTRSADYGERARNLLDDLDAFLGELERRGRPTVVVLIPEHGAALKGDRLQIAGLREIPTPSITHIPVGVKLVGLPLAGGAPQRVAAPSSYLALTELFARLYAGPPAGQGGFDLAALVRDLPQTARVAENSGSVVLDYAGQTYVRLQERGQWLPYPQNGR